MTPKRPVGRPKTPRGRTARGVHVRLSTDELARLDAIRGPRSRPDHLRLWGLQYAPADREWVDLKKLVSAALDKYGRPLEAADKPRKK